MRAVVVEQYGGPEVLQVTEVPDPTPGPDEILVRGTIKDVKPPGLLVDDDPDRCPARTYPSPTARSRNRLTSS